MAAAHDAGVRLPQTVLRTITGAVLCDLLGDMIQQNRLLDTLLPAITSGDYDNEPVLTLITILRTHAGLSPCTVPNVVLKLVATGATVPRQRGSIPPGSSLCVCRDRRSGPCSSSVAGSLRYSTGRGFHAACIAGKTQLALDLIAAGADPTTVLECSTDQDRNDATWAGHFDYALLLPPGTDVDDRDNVPINIALTAFESAIFARKFDTAIAVLDEMMRRNCVVPPPPPERFTPLLTACVSGRRPELACRLLGQFPDVAVSGDCRVDVGCDRFVARDAAHLPRLSSAWDGNLNTTILWLACWLGDNGMFQQLFLRLEESKRADALSLSAAAVRHDGDRPMCLLTATVLGASASRDTIGTIADREDLVAFLLANNVEVANGPHKPAVFDRLYRHRMWRSLRAIVADKRLGIDAWEQTHNNLGSEAIVRACIINGARSSEACDVVRACGSDCIPRGALALAVRCGLDDVTAWIIETAPMPLLSTPFTWNGHGGQSTPAVLAMIQGLKTRLASLGSNVADSSEGAATDVDANDHVSAAMRRLVMQSAAISGDDYALKSVLDDGADVWCGGSLRPADIENAALASMWRNQVETAMVLVQRLGYVPVPDGCVSMDAMAARWGCRSYFAATRGMLRKGAEERGALLGAAVDQLDDCTSAMVALAFGHGRIDAGDGDGDGDELQSRGEVHLGLDSVGWFGNLMQANASRAPEASGLAWCGTNSRSTIGPMAVAVSMGGKPGNSSLATAALCHQTDMVETLLREGCDPWATAEFHRVGSLALHSALATNANDAAVLLIERMDASLDTKIALKIAKTRDDARQLATDAAAGGCARASIWIVDRVLPLIEGDVDANTMDTTTSIISGCVISALACSRFSAAVAITQHFGARAVKMDILANLAEMCSADSRQLLCAGLVLSNDSPEGPIQPTAEAKTTPSSRLGVIAIAHLAVQTAAGVKQPKTTMSSTWAAHLVRQAIELTRTDLVKALVIRRQARDGDSSDDAGVSRVPSGSVDAVDVEFPSSLLSVSSSSPTAAAVLMNGLAWVLAMERWIDATPIRDATPRHLRFARCAELDDASIRTLGDGKWADNVCPSATLPALPDIDSTAPSLVWSAVEVTSGALGLAEPVVTYNVIELLTEFEEFVGAYCDGDARVDIRDLAPFAESQAMYVALKETIACASAVILDRAATMQVTLSTDGLEFEDNPNLNPDFGEEFLGRLRPVRRVMRVPWIQFMASESESSETQRVDWSGVENVWETLASSGELTPLEIVVKSPSTSMAASTPIRSQWNGEGFVDGLGPLADAIDVVSAHGRLPIIARYRHIAPYKQRLTQLTHDKVVVKQMPEGLTACASAVRVVLDTGFVAHLRYAVTAATHIARDYLNSAPRGSTHGSPVDTITARGVGVEMYVNTAAGVLKGALRATTFVADKVVTAWSGCRLGLRWSEGRVMPTLMCHIVLKDTTDLADVFAPTWHTLLRDAIVSLLAPGAGDPLPAPIFDDHEFMCRVDTSHLPYDHARGPVRVWNQKELRILVRLGVRVEHGVVPTKLARFVRAAASQHVFGVPASDWFLSAAEGASVRVTSAAAALLPCLRIANDTLECEMYGSWLHNRNLFGVDRNAFMTTLSNSDASALSVFRALLQRRMRVRIGRDLGWPEELALKDFPLHIECDDADTPNQNVLDELRSIMVGCRVVQEAVGQVAAVWDRDSMRTTLLASQCRFVVRTTVGRLHVVRVDGQRSPIECTLSPSRPQWGDDWTGPAGETIQQERDGTDQPATESSSFIETRFIVYGRCGTNLGGAVFGNAVIAATNHLDSTLRLAAKTANNGGDPVPVPAGDVPVPSFSRLTLVNCDKIMPRTSVASVVAAGSFVVFRFCLSSKTPNTWSTLTHTRNVRVQASGAVHVRGRHIGNVRFYLTAHGPGGDRKTEVEPSSIDYDASGATLVTIRPTKACSHTLSAVLITGLNNSTPRMRTCHRYPLTVLPSVPCTEHSMVQNADNAYYLQSEVRLERPHQVQRIRVRLHDEFNNAIPTHRHEYRELDWICIPFNATGPAEEEALRTQRRRDAPEGLKVRAANRFGLSLDDIDDARRNVFDVSVRKELDMSFVKIGVYWNGSEWSGLRADEVVNHGIALGQTERIPVGAITVHCPRPFHPDVFTRSEPWLEIPELKEIWARVCECATVSDLEAVPIAASDIEKLLKDHAVDCFQVTGLMSSMLMHFARLRFRSTFGGTLDSSFEDFVASVVAVISPKFWRPMLNNCARFAWFFASGLDNGNGVTGVSYNGPRRSMRRRMYPGRRHRQHDVRSLCDFLPVFAPTTAPESDEPSSSGAGAGAGDSGGGSSPTPLSTQAPAMGKGKFHKNHAFLFHTMHCKGRASVQLKDMASDCDAFVSQALLPRAFYDLFWLESNDTGSLLDKANESITAARKRFRDVLLDGCRLFREGRGSQEFLETVMGSSSESREVLEKKFRPITDLTKYAKAKIPAVASLVDFKKWVDDVVGCIEDVSATACLHAVVALLDLERLVHEAAPLSDHDPHTVILDHLTGRLCQWLRDDDVVDALVLCAKSAPEDCDRQRDAESLVQAVCSIGIRSSQALFGATTVAFSNAAGRLLDASALVDNTDANHTTSNVVRVPSLSLAPTLVAPASHELTKLIHPLTSIIAFARRLQLGDIGGKLLQEATVRIGFQAEARRRAASLLHGVCIHQIRQVASHHPPSGLVFTIVSATDAMLTEIAYTAQKQNAIFRSLDKDSADDAVTVSTDKSTATQGLALTFEAYSMLGTLTPTAGELSNQLCRRMLRRVARGRSPGWMVENVALECLCLHSGMPNGSMTQLCSDGLRGLSVGAQYRDTLSVSFIREHIWASAMPISAGDASQVLKRFMPWTDAIADAGVAFAQKMSSCAPKHLQTVMQHPHTSFTVQLGSGSAVLSYALGDGGDPLVIDVSTCQACVLLAISSAPTLTLTYSALSEIFVGFEPELQAALLSLTAQRQQILVHTVVAAQDEARAVAGCADHDHVTFRGRDVFSLNDDSDALRSASVHNWMQVRSVGVHSTAARCQRGGTGATHSSSSRRKMLTSSVLRAARTAFYGPDRRMSLANLTVAVTADTRAVIMPDAEEILQVTHTLVSMDYLRTVRQRGQQLFEYIEPDTDTAPTGDTMVMGDSEDVASGGATVGLMRTASTLEVPLAPTVAKLLDDYTRSSGGPPGGGFITRVYSGSVADVERDANAIARDVDIATKRHAHAHGRAYGRVPSASDSDQCGAASVGLLAEILAEVKQAMSGELDDVCLLFALLRSCNWDVSRMVTAAACPGGVLTLLPSAGIPTQPVVAASDTELNCSVCWDTLPSSTDGTPATWPRCGHALCGECMTTFLTSAVAEGQMGINTSLMCKPCPGDPECKMPVEERVARAALPNEELSAWRIEWERQAAAEYLAVTGVSAACKCGKEHTVRQDPTLIVHCDCGASFCVGCKRYGLPNSSEPHAPATCRQMSEWVQLNTEGDPKRLMLMRIKPCPKCQVVVNKCGCTKKIICDQLEVCPNAACDHITCASCGHEWCWKCSRPYRGHNYRWHDTPVDQRERFVACSRSFKDYCVKADTFSKKHTRLVQLTESPESGPINAHVLVPALAVLYRAQRALQYSQIVVYGASVDTLEIVNARVNLLEQMTSGLRAVADKVQFNTSSDSSSVTGLAIPADGFGISDSNIAMLTHAVESLLKEILDLQHVDLPPAEPESDGNTTHTTLDDNTRAVTSTGAGGEGEGEGGGGQGDGEGNLAPVDDPFAHATANEVAILNMGFLDLGAVRAALAATGDNVDRALDQLLRL